jgi:hypothetical protein
MTRLGSQVSLEVPLQLTTTPCIKSALNTLIKIANIKTAVQ